MKYKKGNIVSALDESRKYQDYKFEETAKFRKGIVISVIDNVSLYDPSGGSGLRSQQVQSCNILMSSGSVRTFYSNELDYFTRIIEKRNACKVKKHLV
jgi:hypothetical protein